MTTTTAADQGALRPWHLFFLVSMVAASFAVWNSPDTRPAALFLLSFTAFAVFGVGVATFRALQPFAESQHADPETQALSERAREALDREKMLVLRAIKELEFDRAMGKIADNDFADMSGRLRAHAAGLMQQLDADTGGYRAAIERDLQALVGVSSAKPAVVAAPISGPTKSAAASADVSASTTPAVAAPEVLSATKAEACPSCATPNDHDARFCKRCGSPLSAA